MDPAIIIQSVITCPLCNFQKEETMEVNACRFFYQCTSCNTLLKPKKGDCCVFCSYGSIKCPPVQLNNCCC
ncbi:MAG TPA: GDCCVxC domain-containing (seleno)protein [Candidatus Nitrosocosmicus sp.]